MMEDNIAVRLKFLIQKLGITNSVFADTCGIPRANLSQMLSGRNKKISDVVIRQIHSAYPALSISWLLFNEGDIWNGQPPVAPQDQDDRNNLESDSEGNLITSNSRFIENQGMETSNRNKNADDFSENPYEDTGSPFFSKENGVNPQPNPKQDSINKTVNDCIKTSELINEIDNFRRKKKKIIQITVYYDDSTFESFFPR